MRRENCADLARQTVLASLVYLAIDARDRLSAVRAIWANNAVASARGNRLVLRVEGQGRWVIRQTLIAIINMLGACGMPRVWQS